MKKLIRLTAFIFAVLLCCLSFVGCDMLDDMKQHHGTWTEDGNILINGIEYIRLPESTFFSPTTDTSDTAISVTEEGVPVLLSSISSDGYGYSTSDGSVIYWVSYTEDFGYYCREDRYDELKARIDAGFEPEGYYYNYYNYEDNTDHVYALTKAEVEAVAAVKNTVEPTAVPPSANVYYDYTIYLYECSQDLLFRREAFEICMSNDEYCIVDQYDEDTMIYQVPDEYKDTFESIFETYINAENYWYDDYYYEEELYA